MTFCVNNMPLQPMNSISGSQRQGSSHMIFVVLQHYFTCLHGINKVAMLTAIQHSIFSCVSRYWPENTEVFRDKLGKIHNMLSLSFSITYTSVSEFPINFEFLCNTCHGMIFLQNKVKFIIWSIFPTCFGMCITFRAMFMFQALAARRVNIICTINTVVFVMAVGGCLFLRCCMMCMFSYFFVLAIFHLGSATVTD